MHYLPEPAFTHGSPEHTGILLVNLGTPDAPTPQALRRYLRQFLGDRRVIELPRLLWWPILNGIILNTRPKQSAAKYASIWLPQGSPLRIHTERQAALLQEQLARRSQTPLSVEYAMRYGSPSIPEVLERLQQRNCQRLLVIPLYPQYSASTTATVTDVVYGILQRRRNTPALRTVKHFHDHPAYIRAIASGIRGYWERHGEPDVLVMSFHGLPRAMLDAGDPYHCECLKSGRLIAEALGLATERYRVTFQSRFGRGEWLQPYTSATLQELGRQKTRRVDVVCPGFVADCLETLEEIAQEGRETFQHAGGGDYHYLPCLNENPDWIAALAELALDNLHGWLETPDAAALEQCRQRALKHGAPR